ncbi:MAG: hypothetical protein PHF84_08735, partial [bacterium]|nr:hypothetical protein [bacterium]
MKKLYVTLLLSVLYLSGLYGETATIKYFRKAELDGRFSITGREAIQDSIINRVYLYYTFEYDQQERLISIKYSEGGKLKNDEVFGAAQVRIDYQENTETRTFKDIKGQPIADKNGVFQVRIKLDDKGNRTTLFNYDKYSSLVLDIWGAAEYVWTLDEKGRRLKTVCYDETGRRLPDDYGFSEIWYK